MSMEILNEALPLGVKIFFFFLMGQGVTLNILLIWAAITHFIEEYKHRQYVKGYSKGFDEGRDRGFDEARAMYKEERSEKDVKKEV